MGSSSAECPSLADLEAYLDGGAADGQLTSHIDRCPDCRVQLQDVRANNALLARMSQTGDAPAVAIPDVNAKIGSESG